MLDWLFEGWWGIYLPLIVALLILVALWWRDRRRVWLFASCGAALLLGVYGVLDLAVETASEQIKRKLTEMSRAVGQRDVRAIFAHVSEEFALEDLRGLNKEQFQMVADRFIQNGTVTELAITDVKPESDGKVVFLAKVKGPQFEQLFRIRAQFVRDGDKQWRLKSFTVHNPVSNERHDFGRLVNLGGGLPR